MSDFGVSATIFFYCDTCDVSQCLVFIAGFFSAILGVTETQLAVGHKSGRNRTYFRLTPRLNYYENQAITAPTQHLPLPLFFFSQQTHFTPCKRNSARARACANTGDAITELVQQDKGSVCTLLCLSCHGFVFFYIVTFQLRYWVSFINSSRWLLASRRFQPPPLHPPPRLCLPTPRFVCAWNTFYNQPSPRLARLVRSRDRLDPGAGRGGAEARPNSEDGH